MAHLILIVQDWSRKEGRTEGNEGSCWARQTDQGACAPDEAEFRAFLRFLHQRHAGNEWV